MNSELSDRGGMGQTWLGKATVQYAMVGVLAGLLFPLVASSIRCYQLGWQITLTNLARTQQSDPLLWIIDTAPFFLGLFAAFAGRRQDTVLQSNKALRERDAEVTSVHANLEQVVAERTQELDERNAQMRAVVTFGRRVADIQDPPALLSLAVDTIKAQFGQSESDLFLLDETGRSAILLASSSPTGKARVDDGFRVPVDEKTMVGRAAKRGKLFLSASRPERAGQITHPRSEPGVPTEVVIPLVARGKVIGVLDVHPPESRPMGQREAEILQLLADQLAASIENARLVSEAQTRLQQLQAVTAENTRSAWQEYLKTSRIAYQFTPAGIRTATGAPASSGAERLSARILLRGQAIGSISMERRTRGDWTETENELLQKVAGQVALALENVRLLEETRHRAAQQQTVSEIAARLTRSLDVDTVLQAAVRELAALPDVAEATVLLKPSEESAPPKSNGAHS